ncbi:MAG: hypothetical protein AAGF23_03195 [Acidobacteriota bacterium]
MRRAVYALVFLFFLARYDLWQMDDPSLLFGLPVGLSYHVLYTTATIGVLALLVRFAWPGHLANEAEDTAAGRPDAGDRR